MKNLFTVISVIFFCSGCVTQYGIQKPDGTPCKTSEEAFLYADSLDDFSKLKGFRNATEKRREFYFNNLRGNNPKIDLAVLEGQILTGMTVEQVLWSWGSPVSRSRTVGVYGKHEQWVYGGYSQPQNQIYLYFDNDILSEWQDFK